MFGTSHRDQKPLICLLCLLLRRCLKVLGNSCNAPIKRKQLFDSKMRPEAGFVPVAGEKIQAGPVARHRHGQLTRPPALRAGHLGLGNGVQQGAWKQRRQSTNVWWCNIYTEMWKNWKSKHRDRLETEKMLRCFLDACKYLVRRFHKINQQGFQTIEYCRD